MLKHLHTVIIHEYQLSFNPHLLTAKSCWSVLKMCPLIVKVTIFLNANLTLICPSTFGMHRQGEHALRVFLVF